MHKNGILVCAICLCITACSLSPTPETIDERYAEAQLDLKGMNDAKHNPGKHINFYQALARGLKYNLDYRIKTANNALQMGQLKVAEYALFPAINTSYSTYARDNDLSSSSTTSTGSVSDVSNSTPRVVQSQRVSISWAAIDFGLGYVRAQEQANRYLVAREEARRQLQQLSQDILTSYWEAYSAQNLMLDANEFQAELKDAKEKITAAIQDKTIPKENIYNYKEALLNGERQLVQLKFKYDKAMYDLKHLLNIPLGSTFILEKPPELLLKKPDLTNLNFEKLDAITLVSRPELWGQSYQEKIAKLGVRTAIIQALPGITLNEGWNYNSNKYLLHSNWTDRSMDLAWNLLNLVSLPASIHSANDQVKYEKMKLMALTIAVLTETRYAYSHYQNLRDEYQIVKAQTKNASDMYTLAKNREASSLASNQQVILAKMHLLVSKMDENLLQSELSKSMGELYLSAGFDMLPIGIDNKPLPFIINAIQKWFKLQDKMDFNRYVDFIYYRFFTPKKPIVITKAAPIMHKIPTPWQYSFNNNTRALPNPGSE